jgi:hypothetical protein
MRLHHPDTWANLVFVGDPTPSNLLSLLVRCHCGYHVAPPCIVQGQVWRLFVSETFSSSPGESIPELERCQRCSIWADLISLCLLLLMRHMLLLSPPPSTTACQNHSSPVVPYQYPREIDCVQESYLGQCG